MLCKSKISIEDKYSPNREVYQGKKKILVPIFYCRSGDELTIITFNAGSWCNAVVCENKKKQRFVMLWKNLEIIEEENYLTF